MFQEFPYTDMHQLNLDWIIKIAKDFLDQYTHIQQLIEEGETSLQNLTETGLDQLQEKAEALQALLDEWYNTHSEDIAGQLADALDDLNTWYTQHQDDISDDLQTAILAFNQAADTKTAAAIASIPSDYTALTNRVTNLENQFEETGGIVNPVNMFINPLFFEDFDDDWIANVGTYEIIKLADYAGYGVKPEASSGVVRIQTFIPIEQFTTSTTYTIRCRKFPAVSGRTVVIEADSSKQTLSTLFNSDPTSSDYNFTFTTPESFNANTAYIAFQFSNTSGGTATMFSLPMLYAGTQDEEFFTPLYYEIYNAELQKQLPSVVNVKNMFPNPLFFNGVMGEWYTNSENSSVVNIPSGGYGFNTGTSENAIRLYTALPVSLFKTNRVYTIRCRKTVHITGRTIVLEADNSLTPTSYILNSDSTVGDFDFTFTTPNAFDNSTAFLIFQFTNTSGGTATTFFEPMLIEGTSEEDFYSLFYRTIANPADEMLYGKKICLAGDSICAGISNSGGYGALLASMYGMNVQNVAVHGACISQVPNKACISELVENLDNDGAFYIYEGGFNDASNSVILGGDTFSETIDNSMTFNMTVFRDAFEYLCRDLVLNRKTKKIGFLFPHKITNRETGNWGNFKALMYKLLDKYGIPFLDLAKVSGFDTALTDLAAYTNNSDGVHPTEAGYKAFYIDKIASWLRSL